jgi:peptide-methionine (S)-S-oxide reductase
MRSLIFTLICILGGISCGHTQSNNLKIPVGSKNPGKNEAVATFAEGCFWHAEIIFQSLEGVRDAVSGYAGGNSTNPNYESVAGGKTGHAETVQVYYDPSKITFATLVAAFFSSHDPTQYNRQGNDIGSEYRSIAFYRSTEERKIIEEQIKKINSSGKFKHAIVTEVVPIAKFYPAEAYHQEYISTHPKNGYVQNVSIPEYLAFRKEFKGKFKD